MLQLAGHGVVGLALLLAVPRLLVWGDSEGVFRLSAFPVSRRVLQQR